MAKGAVMDLREAGIAAGLVRPITLWPFPIDEMRAILTKRPRARVVVVEASPGQLEDELRLALSHAGLAPPPIQSVRRMGGVLPQRREIVAAVLAGQDVAASGGVA
jgi:pyruvate/2-oxoacid:ferredoxin oxidoreductase alpha subunit